MTMRQIKFERLRGSALVAACAAFLVVGQTVRAQQPQPQPGQDAANGQAPDQAPGNGPLGPIGGVNNADADQVPPAGNVNLAGVQNLSAGVETSRSYWQPHFDVTGSGDSNSLETPNGLDWRTFTSISGGIDLHQVTPESDLKLGYTSGVQISNDHNVSNGVVQGLNFAEKYSMHRTILSVFDNFSYLPESAFGFDGLGATTLPGTGQAGGGLQYGPQQEILTGRETTLSNADAVELDRILDRRSSLTFSGGYSLLHYFDSNLFNYGVINARVGYNYQVTERDTFAVFYTYSDYRYDISTNSFDDHVLQVSWGRLINGTLAFQVAGGPLLLVPRGVASGGTPTNAGTQLEWALDANLQYTRRRYGTSVTYEHGIGGGSGAFVGAKTDLITGQLTRQMSRTFTSGITGGYSHTQGLSPTGATTNELFNYWFAGATFTQPLTRTIALTGSYQFQYQTATNVTCIGPACGAVKRNLISVGLGWHERPLLF
jgi:hypothetical protein